MSFSINDLFLLPLPKQRPEHSGRMTVVLDLDETLVHSIFLRDIHDLPTTTSKIIKVIKRLRKKCDLYLRNVGNYGDVFVFFRPGLYRFLKKLSVTCEVVLWTAACRSYAKPILDFIDPDGVLLPYRLFRQHTIQKEKECVKDLSLLGRDMKCTVLIDNSRDALARAPRNCYLISDFYGDSNDHELEKVWSVICTTNEYHIYTGDIRFKLQSLTAMERMVKDNPLKQLQWKKVFITKTRFVYQKVLSDEVKV